VVTTEGDEVVVAFVLIPFEAQRHGWILHCLYGCPTFATALSSLRCVVVLGLDCVWIVAGTKIAHLSRLRRRRWGTRLAVVRSDEGHPSTRRSGSIDAARPMTYLY
jgi:hypothetical protein